MPKYISGRYKKTPQSGLSSDRYRYLSPGDAEPNLGDSPSIQGSPNLPSGQQFIVVSFIDRPGERFWIPNQGGVIPGSLSIFEEGTLVGGLSSTTQLNFVGQSITAQGVGGANPGVAVTVTVAPPGNLNEVLFVGAGGTDFDTDTRFTFNNGLFAAGDRITVGTGGTVITTTGIGSVGIGTTNPTQKLHLNGDFRITGTIYDSLNQPGDTGDLIVKTATGGLSWVAPKSVTSGAGGTIGQIQYHNTAGLVDGASNFYYDFNNNRVGIGSTQPTQLLDVLGVSRFTGDVNFIGDNYNLLWDKSQDSLEFKDETKATFGDGKDLQILHTDSLSSQTDSNGDSIVDGRTSLIKESGSGGLIFKSNGGDGPGAYQFFDQNWHPLLKLHGGNDARVALYYGGVKRLETTGYGVTITGGLGVSGITTLQTLDIQNLDVAGISTLGNVIVNTNTISTKSGTGNLVIDSDASVNIKDPLIVSGQTESTNKDSGSLVVEGGIGVEKSVNIGLNLDVDGNTELDTLNVSVASTTASLTVGTGVAVTTILDEDDMSSNSDTALATQQSIKTYIDSQTTAQDLDFAGDSGSGSVDLDSQTFTISGTTNEIETTGSNQTLTIGLPNNVTVSGNLTVNGNTTLGNDGTDGGDTVIFGSRISSNILPNANNAYDLGSTNRKWDNVYATTFNGAFQGTADTADKLTTPREISFGTDVVAIAKTFDGTQNVGFALTLANSGVSAGTYGSSTQVGIVTVDSKGRVTAASNVNINFADATVDIAKKLETARTFTLGEGSSDDIVAIAKTFDGTQNVGFALTLKNVGPGAGTYGGDNKLISLALDDKGRVTGVTSTSIDFGIANVATADSLTNSRNIAATGDITWNVNFKGHENVTAAATLSNTTVSAGSYGSPTQVGTFTVDTQGRLTAAGNTSIDFAGATVGNANYADNAGIATNLKGGGAYQIPYQSAANTTQFIPNGSVTGQLLQYNQSSAPSWVSVGEISAGTASTANNLSGGAAGSIPYQTGPGITSFLGEPDADDKVLSYNNSTNAPVWVNSSTIGTDNYVDGVSFGGNTLTLTRTGSLTDLTTTISLAGIGGTNKFTGLTDTPANYNSAGGKVVTVNSSEDGLEFTTASTIGTDNYVDSVSFSGGTLTLGRTGSLTDLTTTISLAGIGGTNAFTGLTDTPSNYTNQGGKLVAVNSGASGLEFIDAPGVGTSYTLPASGNTSSVTITLTGSDSSTDPVTITAGTGVSFANVSQSGFTINSSGGSGGSSDPVGTIVAWAGSVASIPSEYQLCDGGAAQTTALSAITGANVPDLRERFIVGAGGDNPTVAGSTGYGVSATGGANTVTLTLNQIPAHDHQYNRANSRTVSDGGVVGAEVLNNNFQTTGSAGGGQAHENLPPYYALCYIIKHTATSGSGSGSGFVLLGPKTATGSSSVEFTGIPADALEITLMFEAVSGSTGADFDVQLGTSSGYITSNYNSSSEQAGGEANSTSTTSFVIRSNSSNRSFHGSMIINKSSSNSYVEIGQFKKSSDGAVDCYGSLSSVSGVVDRLKVSIGNGNFDAGLIGLSYKTSGSGEDGGVGIGSTSKIIQGNTEAEVVDTGSDGHFKVTTEGTERLRVTPDGFVGIGSTMPAGVLDINSTTGDANVYIRTFSNNLGNTQILFGDSDKNDSGKVQYNHPGDYMVFHTNSSEQVRITSNGSVGIGTTNPTATLDVNGTVALGSSVYDSNGNTGTSGQVLSSVPGIGVSWTDQTGGSGVSGSGTTKVAILSDVKTAGTDGGDFNTGAWRNRELNTQVDPESFVTLNNNYFELGEGSYRISWSAPAHAVDKHQTRLTYANNTSFSNSSEVYGTSEACFDPILEGNNNIQTRSFGETIITITETTYFKIQHRCQDSKSGSGFGLSQNFNNEGTNEAIYTQVVIQDLSSGGSGGSGGSSDSVGTIVAWSGSFLSIPSEYQLCDGSAAQTTELQAITGANVPDLRSRFIVGAANTTGIGTYPNVGLGSTGGSADSVVVSHTHDVTNQTGQGNAWIAFSRDDISPNTNSEGNNGTGYQTGAGSEGNDRIFNIASQGEDAGNKNLPPYYALFYIIKHTATSGSGGGGIELLSPKTATGTSVEFTDIPADAKEITLMFSEVGVGNTTNHLLVQLGTSSGWINTGYYASSEAENGGTDVSASDGFPIHNKNNTDSAGNRFTGSMIINLFKTSPSKTYTQIGQFKRYNDSDDCEDCSSACQTYGNVDSISGDITRIRVLANHTGSGQSFTNGEINVSCNSGGSGGGSLIKHGTVATNTGTEAAFTSIPSTAKKIIVAIHNFGVSGSGSDVVLRVGDSSGYATSGYQSSFDKKDQTSNTQSATDSYGIIVNADAGLEYNTTVELVNVTGNSWTISHVGGSSSSDGEVIHGGGSISLSNALDRLKVFGGGSLDHGHVTVYYENQGGSGSGGAGFVDKIEEGDSKAEIIDTASESKFTVHIDNAEKLSVDIGGTKIHRQDNSNEGGSIVLNRAADDATAFELDVYGSSNSDSGRLRIIDQSGSTGVERFEIGPAGQIGVGGSNYGSSGQVLTSNGSGSAPTWQTVSGGGGISGITVQDEGSALSTTATTLNFVGAGVTASGTGATKTITINGGGGSGGAIPSGVIMLWSGASNAIPTGYVLCDGNNSTPDLRDKFIVGANDITGTGSWPSVGVGSTGGSADAIVVSHTHGVGTLSGSLSGSTNSGGSHSHTVPTYTYDTEREGTGIRYHGNSLDDGEQTNITTSSHNGHTHNLSGVTVSLSGSTGSQGSSGTNANLPPYYALCYIMKT